MTKLFITAENVKETTSISGATDNDSISQKIYYAQITDLVRVLGQDLYDYFLNTETYTGEHLVIFNKYIIDMHVFFAAHYFTIFNEVKSSNAGNNIMSITNGQPTQKTIQLAEQYKSLAISVETNFRKYMENSTIIEWTNEQKTEETTNFNDFY